MFLTVNNSITHHATSRIYITHHTIRKNHTTQRASDPVESPETVYAVTHCQLNVIICKAATLVLIVITDFFRLYRDEDASSYTSYCHSSSLLRCRKKNDRANLVCLITDKISYCLNLVWGRAKRRGYLLLRIQKVVC